MRLMRFTLTGDYLDQAPLPPYGSSPLVYMFREFAPSDACLFKHETFTQKLTLYQLDLITGDLAVIGEPGEKLNGIAVSQRFATSKDNTKVPYFVVHREDLDHNEPNPTLITAYGGFNQAWLPNYLAHLVPFIDAGGIFVLGCLRGGGEYGKEWHEAGRLKNKQNTFDDLYAVAEDLIDTGMTAPSQLAFHGMSNGGLLAGAAIVQRPDLWKAVAAGVPMFDMMTPAPDPAIQAYTEAEYGNPNNPTDAEVIFRYSPYHNIRDGLAYPAVLQYFGEKDESSAPFHGRKFTARLTEANAGDNPILLRVWSDTGHAGLGPTGVMQIAEWLSFVMSQLGLDI
jgi:prolyl oligopeptidase